MTDPSRIPLAGVIGSPDALRGQVVKAYVVPAKGAPTDDAAVKALQDHVRRHLSGHEYPRAVRFIDEMPLTVTGKIRRVALRELDSKEP